MSGQKTHDKIVEDLSYLGVTRGISLLVHVSLKSLGPIYGGTHTLLKALITTIGPDGTLLVPALSYDSVNANNPVFDVRLTPSCIGAFPEYFRTRRGTNRSIHPTHSVCGTGPKAAYFFRDHVKDTTPCGQNSTFFKLGKAGGKILFLGCGLKPNTSMHAIEERIVPPYLYRDYVNYRIIVDSEREVFMRVRRHNFAGYTQRYDRLNTVLPFPGIIKGKVLDADADLVDARTMWNAALLVLEDDPFFFVDRITV